MNRPNDLAARAAKLTDRAKKPTPLADVEVTNAKGGAGRQPIPRAKPVRLSLDLAPQSYRSLKAFCDELAVELGRARVTQSEVMRAMVALLDEAPAVRQAVTEAIRDER
ncbi:hypothetical protein V5D56_00070 (plasmid) [Cellulosimicrobium sp. PMB13]|uniref:hypothetical protein n=1 Tax=Cellulosimicrobium sp. PMB13 TaxID=3120158 RepID=UPI003F4BBC0F